MKKTIKKRRTAVIKEEKKRLQNEDISGIFFVTRRWIGGTLTNLNEVSKNYKKLKDITVRLKNEYEKAKYTKKEIGDWEKERQKLDVFYGGTAEMVSIPDALFIIDTHLEHVAAKEALLAKVPTVGITDTNADPTIITYPIPANDDAVGSLKLIINYILDAWIEGKKQETRSKNQEEGKEEKEKKDKTDVKVEIVTGEIKETEKKETKEKKAPKKLSKAKESKKPKKDDSKENLNS